MRLLIILLCMTTQNLFAEDSKIGFVDVKYVLESSKEGFDVREKLEKHASQLEKDLEKKFQEYQKEEEKYKNLMKNPELLNEKGKKSAQEKLAKSQFELEKYKQEVQMDLLNKEAELKSPILEKVEEAVNKLAKEYNLDYVMEAQAGKSIILYSKKEKIDLTTAVLEYVNKN